MKKKLTQELCYLQTENEKLEFSKDELEHAKLMLMKPEDVCIHNLKAREFRQGSLKDCRITFILCLSSGVDLVDDVVQESLRQEINEIKRIRGEFEKLLEQVESQLKKNEEIRKKMKQDISEKKSALDIDRNCTNLGVLSAKIHIHIGNHIVRLYFSIIHIFKLLFLAWS